MRLFRRQSLPRVIISIMTAVLFLGMSFPAFAVSISAPKPMSKVKGTVQVLAIPNAGEGKYTYAILLVDQERMSITNAQPLRFELDTTGLPNGTHLLQVELNDLAGLLSTSKTVKVIVANPVPGGQVALPAAPQPVPAPAQPKVVTPAPKPVTPAQPKVATPAPKPAPAQPVATPAPKPAVPAAQVPQPKPAPVPPVAANPPVIAPVVQPMQPAVAPRAIRGTDLSVVLDGKPLTLSVRPIVDRGRTLVVLRPLIDALGGTLTWDAEKKQAIAMIEQRQYTFTIGESVVQVDGQSMPIDRPAVLMADRTVVPITVWRDLFGGSLDYDSDYGSIKLKMRLKEAPGSIIAAK